RGEILELLLREENSARRGAAEELLGVDRQTAVAARALGLGAPPADPLHGSLRVEQELRERALRDMRGGDARSLLALEADRFTEAARREPRVGRRKKRRARVCVDRARERHGGDWGSPRTDPGEDGHREDGGEQHAAEGDS